ncbi:HNH endonuclease [Klebsiella sp. K796]|uniref:HNH endonuclease n=1 Tax=Klebsiella TaxID=570 RepID=UPI0021133EE4|nr:HNH endonuclease [Klebsiella pneumoniae]MCQ6406379.1 HNH endonuclease [Klebsiella pneumoniae]
MKSINIQELKRMLHYDKSTGVFTWLVKPNRRIKVGSVAGSITRFGYVKIKINGIDYKAHRLAWLYVNGQWPEKGIDHKDTIKTHNWIENLREADQPQNMANCGAHKNNSSGYKGVCLHKPSGKWYARIRYEGKRVSLGLYDTPEEAFDAYCAESRDKHGEFSNTASVELIPGCAIGVVKTEAA